MAHSWKTAISSVCVDFFFIFYSTGAATFTKDKYSVALPARAMRPVIMTLPDGFATYIIIIFTLSSPSLYA